MGLAEMQKPFDKEALVAEMKAQGLPVLEEAVEKALVAFLSWLKKSGEIHENPYVKALVPSAVDIAQPLVLGQADKIDGVIGQ